MLVISSGGTGTFLIQGGGIVVELLKKIETLQNENLETPKTDLE